ncbi:hypothetical protein [Bacillus alkalicellulosilyticus]|uniref:hypothetical protein n=1 Tax=Alkalihalobacterium alkalicellulosilyticum TaxID=1912214 RepID=UPI00099730AC|nr:hypothetical protein [Bacillus alkalicellulosilyticus]
MKKLSIVLALLIFSGCGVIENKTLQQQVNEKIADKETEEIILSQITDFSWDEAFIFAPYTSEDYMKKRIGSDYKDKTNISYRDDINILVFVHDGKVVQYAEIERTNGDFLVSNGKRITPDHSSIQVKRHSS